MGLVSPSQEILSTLGGMWDCFFGGLVWLAWERGWLLSWGLRVFASVGRTTICFCLLPRDVMSNVIKDLNVSSTSSIGFEVE